MNPPLPSPPLKGRVKGLSSGMEVATVGAKGIADSHPWILSESPTIMATPVSSSLSGSSRPLWGAPGCPVHPPAPVHFGLRVLGSSACFFKPRPRLFWPRLLGSPPPPVATRASLLREASSCTSLSKEFPVIVFKTSPCSQRFLTQGRSSYFGVLGDSAFSLSVPPCLDPANNLRAVSHLDQMGTHVSLLTL